MPRPDFATVIVFERVADVYSARSAHAGQRVDATPGHIAGDACLLSLWRSLSELLDQSPREIILPGDVP